MTASPTSAPKPLTDEQWSRLQRFATDIPIPYAAEWLPQCIATITALRAQLDEAKQSDGEPYKEALAELCNLLSEQEALNGGGPGFKARWDKAYGHALALVRGE